MEDGLGGSARQPVGLAEGEPRNCRGSSIQGQPGWEFPTPKASMGPQSKSTYQVPRKERDPHVVTKAALPLPGAFCSHHARPVPLPGSSCQCPALVWPHFPSWYREESPGSGVRRRRFEPHPCGCLTELPFLLLKWGRTRMTEPLHRKGPWGGITTADLAAAPTGASWVPTPRVSISHQRKGMLTHPHRGL